MSKTQTNLSAKTLEAILAIDPNATGSIIVDRNSENEIFVTGVLETTKKNYTEDRLLREALAKVFSKESLPLALFTNLTVNKKLQVTTTVDNSVAGVDSSKKNEKLYIEDSSNPSRRERHVNVIYNGFMKVALITENTEYKKENWQTRDKVGNCIVELGFIAPIIVDRNFKVIDGNQRLNLAKELELSEIQVIVLDIEGTKADFLRLALNRSTEFQKWKHDEVDPFVNDNPMLQPLLEPLGFYGERIIPVSYFGDTMISYKIDPYNYQQTAYKQEEGLAKWAEIQRARIMEQQKQREKKRIKPDIGSLEDGLFG